MILAGTAEPTGGGGGGAAPLADEDVAARVEARWTSCPRGAMLRARFRDAVATSSVTGADGDVQGYAMATSQESTAMVGPVIAETEEEARILVGSILRACADRPHRRARRATGLPPMAAGARASRAGDAGGDGQGGDAPALATDAAICARFAGLGMMR